MAQRFGGKYSPDGAARPEVLAAEPFQGARRSRAGFRTAMLFVMPFCFVATAFFQRTTGLATDLAAFAILMLAAWLTREARSRVSGSRRKDASVQRQRASRSRPRARAHS